MFGRRYTPDPDELEVQSLTDAWDRACRGAGLVRKVDTVSGTTEIVPSLVLVDLSKRALSVRLEPGMTVGDIRTLAPRIAPYLGSWGLRAEPFGNGAGAVVTLLPSDPLGRGSLPCPDSGPVLVGLSEQGERLVVDDPADIGHVAVQGATRSGKSAFLYSLLSAYARYQRSEYPITVSGIDPSGILLRPWPGSVLGLSDPAHVERHLTDAVADMDSRIAAIPHDQDTLELGDDHPLSVIVVEEMPGLYRWLDAIDTKAGKRVRALLARLLSEGAKAGIRVILVAQRAEAGIIGANERAQCSLRLTFRVDNLDAVKLLHPDADSAIAEAHARELPGIALLSAPGRPLTRVRGPWIGDYAEYVRRVTR